MVKTSKRKSVMNWLASVFVVTMLLTLAPASAVELEVSAGAYSVYETDKVSFKAKVDINSNEKQNIEKVVFSIQDDFGQAVSSCSFDLMGNKLFSQCDSNFGTIIKTEKTYVSGGYGNLGDSMTVFEYTLDWESIEVSADQRFNVVMKAYSNDGTKVYDSLRDLEIEVKNSASTKTSTNSGGVFIQTDNGLVRGFESGDQVVLQRTQGQVLTSQNVEVLTTEKYTVAPVGVDRAVIIADDELIIEKEALEVESTKKTQNNEELNWFEKIVSWFFN